MVKALRAFQMYMPEQPDLPARHPERAHRVHADLGRHGGAGAHGGRDRIHLGRSGRLSPDQQERKPGLESVQGWDAGADDPQGCGGGGVPRLLATINQARFLPTDAGDDLLTLLWAHEFQLIEYRFIDFFGEGGGAVPRPRRDHRRADRRRSAGPRWPRRRPQAQGRGGRRRLRLHTVLPRRSEIGYLARELEEEYQRDVRGSALNVLFDLMELKPTAAVRDEVLRRPRATLPQPPQQPGLPQCRRGAAGDPSSCGSRSPDLQPEQIQRLGRLRGPAERARHRGAVAPVAR